MNVITVSPQFDRMRNFMLDVDKYFEPLNYVAQAVSNNGAYPPHNIHKKDKQYIIEMALAGFSKEDVEVEIEPNILTIKSVKKPDESDKDINYAFKGIAKRGFRRVFYLADKMRVVSCKMKDGMLHIAIEKEIPEKPKPKTITID